MTNVQTFMFALPAGTATMQVPVRTVEIDGAPWFVAADVCRCLGIGYDPTTGKTNASPFMPRLGDDEKRVLKRQTRFAVKQGVGTDSENQTLSDIGGPKLAAVTIIAESGLYKLVMRSDKPEARKFQDWVTRDVLPAIRKDGGYIMGEGGRPMGALRDLLQRPHHCPLPM